MSSADTEAISDERPELLILCGLLGLLTPVVMSIGIVVVAMVSPDYSWIEDTISDLARGDTSWIMDKLFYLNAAGMIALALGAAHLHLGRWDWSLGMFALVFLALIIVLLGVWDQFYSQPGVEKMSVHTTLATVLFPLYLIGPLAMARGAGTISSVYRWLFVAAGILWPITALIYFFGPSQYYGLTERIAGGMTLLLTVPLGWMFLSRGRKTM
ncbi:MAG: DUF998 domain-containing protein [Silicimonas sp.]|nr:DUF998 domain-containing protein [Silicimonas sp.]